MTVNHNCLLDLVSGSLRLETECKSPLNVTLAQKAIALLLKFHEVFSLEPNEIGFTDAMEHIIELLKDEQFKEPFQHIVPPLVDEVCQHMQEMIDGSTIQPSQSPWCNPMCW